MEQGGLIKWYSVLDVNELRLDSEECKDF